MAEIGHSAVFLTLLTGIYTAVIMVWGAAKGSNRMLDSGRRGSWAAAGLSTVSVLALLYLLLSNDFGYQYVYETTRTIQPLAYHISALWQGQAGSILFWLWSLSLLTALLTILRRPSGRAEMPYALAILGALEAFFAFLLLRAANPFEPARQFYAEGFGGNPLLENPGMIYHPPTILAAYAATAIPFALVMGGLIAGCFDDRDWLRGVRPWVILSWLLLTVGILMGAQWAYLELGWGGYWGWDPVENASLIPWLANTGLVHSLVMLDRRGMFKLWSVILVAATFLLCIFATWVTRGGAINSVHAFGVSSAGDIFLLGLVALSILSVLVISGQRRQLQSEFDIRGAASREASFLYTAVFFSVAAALVLLGTVFPGISRALWGRQVAWGPEGYDRVTRILAPFLLVLMGVCPVVGWRRTEGRKLLRALMVPLVAAILTAVLVLSLEEVVTYAVLAFPLVSFAAVAILGEFYRGWRLRRGKGEGPALALWRLFTRSGRRYGGYLVHLGVLLMVVGITGQSVYQSSRQVALDQGDAVTVGGYTLEYYHSGIEETEANRRFYASLQVYQDDRPVFTLQPQKNFHWNVQQWVTEIALHVSPTEDLYVSLLGLEDDGLASFEIVINPLMSWLWFGGVVLVIGTVVAVWPRKRRSASLPVGS